MAKKPLVIVPQHVTDQMKAEKSALIDSGEKAKVEWGISTDLRESFIHVQHDKPLSKGHHAELLGVSLVALCEAEDVSLEKVIASMNRQSEGKIGRLEQ
jgi:hypothetical protein